MKKLASLLIVLMISSSLYSQNIINTLPTNGNFFIKDATNTFFTLKQSCGNVCIGGTTFDASNPEKLKVDAGNTSSFNVISGYGTINSYLQLNIKNNSNGSDASADLVATNDIGTEDKGYIDVGVNSSNYTESEYKITGKNDGYIYCVGNTGGTPVGGNLCIGTVSTSAVIKFFTGGTQASNERMRIDGNGNVGIGYTDPGSYKLKINGNCYATGFYYPSDIRLKSDIQPLDNTIEKIMKLRGVSFRYNNNNSKKEIGFIAQEMEEVFPEFVTTGEDGLKAVSYSNITAVLLEGIKEQQKQIDDLNTRLIALDKKSSVMQTSSFVPENSNAGLWIFLSAVTLSIAGIVTRKRK
jgi:hypothetical protein